MDLDVDVRYPQLVHDRHDLADAEWDRLERCCRTPARGGRWPDHRQVISGVFWRTRTGAPRRDLPIRRRSGRISMLPARAMRRPRTSRSTS
jgi:transposase